LKKNSLLGLQKFPVPSRREFRCKSLNSLFDWTTKIAAERATRLLPAGDYEVITDEEMIEGLSFAAFRRVATMIMVPATAPRSSAMEMISISSVDLSDAQRIDASAPRE
jgi:hypothetical protein